MPGPVPKRSDVRRRRNKPAGGPVRKAMTAPEPPPAPTPDAEWHPVARDWFESFAGSAESELYEPSDWATARYVAEAISRSLETP